MKEKPIIFTAPMVRAILEGRKTQTRRIVDRIAKIGSVTEFQPSDTPGYDWIMRDKKLRWNDFTDDDLLKICQYGQPRDHLWVRETWDAAGDHIEYYADRGLKYIPRSDESSIRLIRMYDSQRGKWRSSRYMPRWASRINLEITGVRVERLQDITASDAWAEGVPHSPDENPIHAFAEIWEKINGSDSWDKNPWVWVVEFKRVEG